jgi:RNA polymerase sporulation-specific sigma factor
MIDDSDMGGAVNVLMYEARRFGGLFPGIGEEEFVQEGMVGLLESQRGYDPHIAKFSTYAHARIRQRMLERVRKEGSVHVSRYGRAKGDVTSRVYPDGDAEPEDWMDSLTSTRDGEPSFVDELERDELLGLLKDAVNRLPALEREVLAMVLEGKSFQEIGDSLGFTRQNAHHRYGQAVGKLRGAFGL